MWEKVIGGRGRRVTGKFLVGMDWKRECKEVFQRVLPLQHYLKSDRRFKNKYEYSNLVLRITHVECRSKHANTNVFCKHSLRMDLQKEILLYKVN